MLGTAPAWLAKRWQTLSLVAAILLGIFLALWVVEYCEPQERDAYRQANDYRRKEAVDILASERVAYYTKILSIVTGALGGLGVVQVVYLIRANTLAGRQTDILRTQKDMQRQSYFAEHRPKLVIKNVFFKPPDDSRAISIDIANVGGSCATVTDSWFCVAFVESEVGFRDQSDDRLI